MLDALLVLAMAAASPAPAAPAPSPADDALPVLSITARVHADSITITQRGKTEGRVWAEPGGESAWKFDRGGLPKPIAVGKRYDNVDLGLQAEARLDENGVQLSGATEASSQDSQTFVSTPLGGIPVR